ncbi:hypothetical protein ACHAWF_002686 [Thalassiosira exigua]
MIEECVRDEMPRSTSSEEQERERSNFRSNLVADAYKKFPCRAALEDYIRDRQADIDIAAGAGFDADDQTLARGNWAQDEVRKLLPLRLVIQTESDLTNMIEALQADKEEAMKGFDLEQARNIQSEIDAVQVQVDAEKQYLLAKRMGKTMCESCGEMFPTEKKMEGIYYVTEKHCADCKEVDCDHLLNNRKKVTLVLDRDDNMDAGMNAHKDDSSDSSESGNPGGDQPRLEHPGTSGCGFASIFARSWW